MSFANRLYCDAEGGMFLMEVDTSTTLQPPRHIWRIPDQTVLSRLLEETCWARTGSVLVFALAAMVFGFIPDALMVPLFFGAFAIASICGRSASIVMRECPEIAKDDYRMLVLTKDPSLAKLRYVGRVMAGSLFLPVTAFTALHFLSLEPGQGQTTLVSISLGSLFVAGYLILTGSRLSNPRRRDLREPEFPQA